MLEQRTNRNFFVKILNCGVAVKTKDCAGSRRPFQHKLQHHCFHGKVSQLVPQLTMIYYFIFVNSDSCTVRLKVKRKVLTSYGLFADLDMSIAYWNIVLEGRFKFLDIWCEFLLVSKA